jgi:hypothetical protein
MRPGLCGEVSTGEGKFCLPSSKHCLPNKIKKKKVPKNPEIIATLYDWPLWWSSKERRYLRPSEDASVKDWGQNWNRERIGPAEYNRKTAAYYRAFSRLKARGLLTDVGSGLWITDEGMRVAEALVGARVA